jgi:hypothetical protein
LFQLVGKLKDIARSTGATELEVQAILVNQDLKALLIERWGFVETPSGTLQLVTPL